MLELNQSIGYSKSEKVLGAIVEFSVLTETITLMDDNEDTHVVAIDDVIVLKEIGQIGRVNVYQNDVLSNEDGSKLYEVDLNEFGYAVLHLLNDNLERVKQTNLSSFKKELISEYTGVLALVGNIHQLRDKQSKVDFNVAIFRHIDENDGEVTYYNVGNNKDLGEVDLTHAVLFSEDQEYERITLSHEDFLEAIKHGEFKKVDPMEVQNYITGLTYGLDDEEECCEVEEENWPEDEDDILDGLDEPTLPFDGEVENYCEECNKHLDDCQCELWTR